MEHVDPLRGCRPVRAEELEEAATRHRPTTSTVLAYDVYRCGPDLVIEFDVPGVDPSAVELAAEGGELTVSVRRELARGNGIDVVDARRAHGVFTERLVLGPRWDLSRVRARVENGVLTVRAPIASSARQVIPLEMSADRSGSPQFEQGAGREPERVGRERERVEATTAA